MSFSDKIRQSRESKKLTQTELAKLIGVSRQAYATYELGTREPSLETLRKMASVFDVSVDFLLDNDTPAPKEKAPAPEERKHNVEVIAAHTTEGRAVDEARVRELFEELMREQKGKKG